MADVRHEACAEETRSQEGEVDHAHVISVALCISLLFLILILYFCIFLTTTFSYNTALLSLEKEKLESKILESMSHPFIVHLYKV